MPEAAANGMLQYWTLSWFLSKLIEENFLKVLREFGEFELVTEKRKNGSQI